MKRRRQHRSEYGSLWLRASPAARRVAAAGTLLAVAALCAGVIAWRPGSHSESAQSPQRAPVAAPSQAAGWFAYGDASGNVPLDRSQDWVLLRWVARRAGVVSRLWLHVKTEGAVCGKGERSGYAAGSGGRWRVTTHPVLADGRPDLDRALVATDLAPCAVAHDEVLPLPLGLRVHQGQELATVIRNVAAKPAMNYASVNFLYRKDGILGANGRNERDPRARDALFNLDARELVGWSTDSGRTWDLPGGPYGDRLRGSFVPGYLAEFEDHRVSGQPYYSAHPVNGRATMVYAGLPHPWTIRGVAAYTSRPGESDVEIVVGGRRAATSHLAGSGLVRAAVPPLDVPADTPVQLTADSGPGALDLRAVYADRVFADLADLGPRHAWYLAGDPVRAAPLWPLPVQPDALP